MRRVRIVPCIDKTEVPSLPLLPDLVSLRAPAGHLALMAQPPSTTGKAKPRRASRISA